MDINSNSVIHLPTEIFLIFGATGNQGRAVINYFLANQKENRFPLLKIRALVRNVQSAKHLQNLGVELIEGAMEDKIAVQKALNGVSRVFFHTTHNTFKGEKWEAEAQRGLVVVQELAVCNTLEQVIYSTLPYIKDYEEGFGKSEIEAKMRELKLPLTTVLAPFYLENFLHIWPPIRKWFGCWVPLQWGWLPTDKPLRMPHGSVEDFGAVVGTLMEQPVAKYLNRKITVVGQDIALPEVLKRLGDGLGEPILWKPIPLKTFQKLNFPKEALSGLEFYAKNLVDHQIVEAGFLASKGVASSSLEAAVKETYDLYPAMQSIETWAFDHQKELRKKTLMKFSIAVLIFWAKIKALFFHKE